MSLLVVGSLNMDFDSFVDRLPLPGETVSANDFKRISGGKGANQAVACCKKRSKLSL